MLKRFFTIEQRLAVERILSTPLALSTVDGLIANPRRVFSTDNVVVLGQVSFLVASIAAQLS